jgi:hypothetical protein
VGAEWQIAFAMSIVRLTSLDDPNQAIAITRRLTVRTDSNRNTTGKVRIARHPGMICYRFEGDCASARAIWSKVPRVD